MRADCIEVRYIRPWTLLSLTLAIALTACSTADRVLPRKIALIAPFEGQFREIGYNALYAVRLAFDDALTQDVQLMAIDDGGTIESAVARVTALNLDPAVAAIIALGPFATHASPQRANEKPMILIGNWGQDRADEDSLYATNADLAKSLHSGDLFMLTQVRDLHEELDGVSFVSSGSLPDDSFIERYVNSAQYAPEPNLLATLTYDIARLSLAAVSTGTELGAMEYHGINGVLRFEDGYWVGAPLNQYRYENRRLELTTG